MSKTYLTNILAEFSHNLRCKCDVNDSPDGLHLTREIPIIYFMVIYYVAQKRANGDRTVETFSSDKNSSSRLSALFHFQRSYFFGPSQLQSDLGLVEQICYAKINTVES